jgi:hypothetical protein
MGNTTSSNDFYVHARKFNNKWKNQPIFTFIPNEEDAISKFKHLVWRFALRRDETLTPYISIYLYKGDKRIIKAYLEIEEQGYNKIELTFLNDIYASMWDVCEEKILNHDILWQETSFSNVFVPLIHDTEWTRKWVTIKPNNNT